MGGVRRESVFVGGLGVARDHKAVRHLQAFGCEQFEIAQAAPLSRCLIPLVGAGVDLVHAGIQHGQHARDLVLDAGGFRHGQQGIHRQNRYAQTLSGAKGQALGDGAGGAQSGERARAAPEHDHVQRIERERGLGHQLANRRNHGGRRLGTSGRAALVHFAAAWLNGDGKDVGAGVEREEIHGVCRQTGKGRFGERGHLTLSFGGHSMGFLQPDGRKHQ